AAGLAVAGCSSSDAPTTLTGLDLARSRPAPIPLHVGRIAHRVERLRGLRFGRVPKVEVVGPRRLARIGRRLRADAIAHLAARRAGRAGGGGRAPRGRGTDRPAGPLPEPQATEASGATSSAEQIGAAYDYRSGRILLVNRAISSRRQLHLVVAHELTHA